VLFLKKRGGVVERKNVCGLINNEHSGYGMIVKGRGGSVLPLFLLAGKGEFERTFLPYYT
jgi:hypothetical protein